MPIDNDSMHQVDEFDLTFTHTSPGEGYRTVVFKCTESGESHDLGYTHEVVYNVDANPAVPGNVMWLSEYLYTSEEMAALSYPQEEMIVSWNLWRKAGCVLYHGCLAKKWPPRCVKTGPNRYKVTITYAPLFVADFQINPVKTKKKMALGVSAYRRGASGGWTAITNPSQEEAESLYYINEDKEGNVLGVDVLEPSFTWTERWVWGPELILERNVLGVVHDYPRLLAQLSCTVNTGKFRGHDPGEVLFRGASGRQVSPMTFEIDYHFSVRPNRTSVEVAGAMLPAAGHPYQTGWIYVDEDLVETEFQYTRHNQDGQASKVATIPDVVKLQQLYSFSDFGRMLGLHPDIKLSSAQYFAPNADPLESLPTISGDVRPPIEAS